MPNAKLIGDKILFNKKTYHYKDAFELAEKLKFFKKGIRAGNNLVAFRGRSSIFSNFFPCTFRKGKTEYNCCEQMFQNELCLFFGDPQSAKTIMLQSDPMLMKKIGDKVANSDSTKKQQWQAHQAKNLMKTAAYLKFSQNPSLMKELKSKTGKFAEANQYDLTWGTGIALKDDKILDPTRWTGSNWLGEILTELRDKFNSK